MKKIATTERRGVKLVYWQPRMNAPVKPINALVQRARELGGRRA